MAKAAKIHAEAVADDPRAWFAKVLRIRFDEVLKFVDAALDPSETEGIHNMRVAIRRLRGVLRDFTVVADKQRYASLTTLLKKLANALGEVRDIDVLIEELNGFNEKAEENIRPGLERIIADYRDRRTAAHHSLKTVVTGEFVFNLRQRPPSIRPFDSEDCSIPPTFEMKAAGRSSNALLISTPSAKLSIIRPQRNPFTN